MEKSSFKVIVIFVVIGILGLSSIPYLSVRLYPSKVGTSITVSYEWPNASSKSVELYITSLLEGSFNRIKGIKKITSQSKKGYGYISLELDKYADADIVRFDMSASIRQVYNKLPKTARYPTITLNGAEDNEANSPILSYAISAKESSSKIQKTIENYLKPSIGWIKGVEKVTINGAMPLEWIIEYNYDKFKTLNLSKNDILRALTDYFKKESLGTVIDNKSYLGVYFESSSDDSLLWDIPVKNHSGRILYLKDVARVYKKEQNPTSFYRINGNNSIYMNIYSNKNVNTIELAQKISAEIKSIEKSLPNSYSLILISDTTEFLKKELHKNYKRTALTVLILLCFILIISKSFKYLLITVFTIIINLAIAILLYFYFKIEIQMYSLAGIAISLGLIIDNTVVMIDHIRNQKNTMVFIPILASTLTTIGVLSIIYFLEENIRRNLIDFAKVITINLGVSLLVSLFLIPAILDRIKLEKIKPTNESNRSEKVYQVYKIIILFLLRFKKVFVIIVILVFGIPTFLLPNKINIDNSWYAKVYNTVIGNETFSSEIRPHIDTYLGGTLNLFSKNVYFSDYYRDKGETKLSVIGNMEKGSTVEQMNEIFLYLENFISDFKEIKLFRTTIYSGDFAKMEITFEEGFKNGSFPFSLKNKLKKKALNLGGVEWDIFGIGQGFSNAGKNNDPIKLSIQALGYNYDELNQWADTLANNLQKHPRVEKVTIRDNSNWERKKSYEYRMQIDKQKLVLHNTSPSHLLKELKENTLPIDYSKIMINGKEENIRFVSNNSNDFDVWHIKNTLISSNSSPFRLKNSAKIVKEKEEELIDKINQEYARKIEFQYKGARKYGVRFLNKTLADLSSKLPIGFRFEESERYLQNNEEKQSYSFLFVLILGIIYFICAILFESLKQPLIILSVVPISFIGVFLTFYLFDFYFDQGGMSSFVLLSGITVNSSIFILDGYNKLRKKYPHLENIDHFIKAFRQKIFPILVTIVSTILGFIPFIIGGQNEPFWFALGVGTIGGLLFSLLGIILYLPLFTLRKIKV